MQRDTGVLIQRIYDAVDDVDALPDVLSGLCERIGGENGLLGILMKTPGPLPFAVLFRLDPALMPTLNARHLNNVWRQHMVTLPVGIPAASDSFVSFDQLRGTDFHGEILEPWDIGHAALFAIDDAPKFHVAMTIHRSTRRGPFTVTGGARLCTGALNMALRLGLAFPEDISVVGYGDPPYGQVNLSTVSLPTREIAQISGEFLFRKIRERKPGDVADTSPVHETALRPELVLRGSTAEHVARVERSRTSRSGGKRPKRSS